MNFELATLPELRIYESVSCETTYGDRDGNNNSEYDWSILDQSYQLWFLLYM